MEQALRRGEVLEAMLTEILQLERLVQEVTRRLREHDLPAVPGGHHPSRPMHVHPDVAGVRQEWLTRVDPHPHT